MLPSFPNPVAGQLEEIGTSACSVSDIQGHIWEKKKKKEKEGGIKHTHSIKKKETSRPLS